MTTLEEALQSGAGKCYVRATPKVGIREDDERLRDVGGKYREPIFENLIRRIVETIPESSFEVIESVTFSDDYSYILHWTPATNAWIGEDSYNYDKIEPGIWDPRKI